MPTLPAANHAPTDAAVPRFAIVRPPSEAYVGALGQVDGVPPIDLALTLAQHAAYVAALADAGVTVHALAPEPHLPDACFVEDTAVVFDGSALITLPGAPSRRAEVDAVAHALGALGLELVHMSPTSAPLATLDGGDVLRVGATFYVGRSDRTNVQGIAALDAFVRARGGRVVEVPLSPEVLHLKCHASALDPETVLIVEGLTLPGLAARTIAIPRAEAYAANAVAIGRRVLLSGGYPETLARVAAAGFEPVVLGMSELAKAAGSLTCLSVLVGSVGGPVPHDVLRIA